MGLRLEFEGVFKKNIHNILYILQLIWILSYRISFLLFKKKNTDVVYDPEIVVCLVRLLAKLLKIQKKPPEVYISSTIRNPGTYTCFKKELGEFF